MQSRDFKKLVQDTMKSLKAKASVRAKFLHSKCEQQLLNIEAQDFLEIVGPHVIKGLEEAGFPAHEVQAFFNPDTGVIQVVAIGANDKSKIARMH